MQYTIVIPARYASSRFPGKPLADIAGEVFTLYVRPDFQNQCVGRRLLGASFAALRQAQGSRPAQMLVLPAALGAASARLAFFFPFCGAWKLGS